MMKTFNEWVYFMDVKYHDDKTTVLFKEVWMVHKALAYISKATADEWKSYVGVNAVNITYHYDEDDNMVITDALLLNGKKGE
jgi:hypothetical protein